MCQTVAIKNVAHRFVSLRYPLSVDFGFWPCRPFTFSLICPLHTHSLSLLTIISMATSFLPLPCCKNYYSFNFTTVLSPCPKALFYRPIRTASLNSSPKPWLYCHCLHGNSGRRIICKATEVSVAEESSASSDGGGGENWVPVVPLAALPKGERRVIIQDGETILLLWYKDQVYAIENRSPAEGAYTEGLLNAKLTQVGVRSISFFLSFLFFNFSFSCNCFSYIGVIVGIGRPDE